MTSRTQRKAGTKSLACNKCGQAKNGKNIRSFRGRTKARLQQHLRDAHGIS